MIFDMPGSSTVFEEIGNLVSDVMSYVGTHKWRDTWGPE
jgi:hypothetical protein